MCNLFQKRGVLSWNVSVEGYRTSSENTKAMEEFRTWETCGSYQGSLGIIAAMWKTFQGSPNQFMTSYKSVLNQTYLILSQQNENNQNKFQVSFKTLVMWEEKHRQALNILTSPPVLATNRLFTIFYFTY